MNKDKQRIENINKKIASSFFIVGLFVAVGKLAGLAKEIVIAWKFGVGYEVDIYVFIMNLILWPTGVWFSVLSVVLIPLYCEHKSSPDFLRRFRGELAGLTVSTSAIASCIVFLIVLGGDYFEYVKFLRAGKSDVVDMSLWVFLLIPLGFCISYFSALLMAGGRHKNTLLESVPALVICFCLLVFQTKTNYIIIGSTAVGYFLQLFILIYSVRALSGPISLSFTFSSPAWRNVFGRFGIVLFGNMSMSITGLIDPFFAASLETGAISILSYSSKITAMLMGFGALAISRATLPIFSEVFASNDVEKLRRLVQGWGAKLFFLGLFFSISVCFFSKDIVSVLFERGRFDANNTSAVADVLYISAWMLPFYFSSMVFVSYFAAKKDYGINSLNGFLSVFVKVVLSAWLVKIYGIKGLVLSSLIMHALTFIYFIAVFQRKGSEGAL